jgi:hypothetical protein
MPSALKILRSTKIDELCKKDNDIFRLQFSVNIHAVALPLGERSVSQVVARESSHKCARAEESELMFIISDAGGARLRCMHTYRQPTSLGKTNHEYQSLRSRSRRVRAVYILRRASICVYERTSLA